MAEALALNGIHNLERIQIDTSWEEWQRTDIELVVKWLLKNQLNLFAQDLISSNAVFVKIKTFPLRFVILSLECVCKRTK